MSAVSYDPAATPIAGGGYRYLGDRLTDPALRGRRCHAVLRGDGSGKCIRGRNGSMLVWFVGEDAPRVVVARMLRKGAP